MYYLVFKMTNTFHFEGEQKRERASSDKNEECEYRLFAIVQYASDSTACGSFTNLAFEYGGVPEISINGEKSESTQSAENDFEFSSRKQLFSTRYALQEHLMLK